MATVVEALHVAAPSRRRAHRARALLLADTAACECLHDAGVSPRDVDLVASVGIYRDRNIGEPAFASFIQEDVAINPEDPHAGGHGTFSFDLANGVCGPLTAFQVIDRFLRAGTISRGLVVASDADPGHRLAAGFPFAPVGAAAACTWTNDERGFGGFHWGSWWDGGALFNAVVRPDRKGNLLRLAVDAGFARHAAGCAAEVAARALSDAGLSAADIAVTIAGPGDPAFVRELSRRTALAEDRIVTAEPRVHTASLLVALGGARGQGLLRPGAPALVVCAGAGVVAGACIYHP